MGAFKGKRFLVTGGCQGMGRGMAVELWKRGADVVAISNNAENLAALKNEYPSITVATVDLRDWTKSQQAVDALGVFHGLINNAGICIMESVLDCKPESFDLTISINTRAVLSVSQVVCKKMIDNKIKGSVVNISSQSSMAALKDHVAYCASKCAVDSMTRVMALELGAYGVRVNSVHPTVIMTDMGRKVWADPSTSAAMLSRIPMGRFGEVHEVVAAALFLLSDDASMVSGARLPVDGGFLAA